MKKNSIKVNKKTRIASIFLNSINDLDKEKQAYLLDEIAKLFISQRIYVVYVKDIKSSINLDYTKADAVNTKSYKWYDIITMRIENRYLSDIIKISAQNKETTEIYFIDNFDWDKFLEQKNEMKYNEYKAVLVVNDNGGTFINVNMKEFDLDYVSTKINIILENNLKACSTKVLVASNRKSIKKLTAIKN